MSLIIINKSENVSGECSFVQSIAEIGNERTIVYEGTLKINQYFEEIITIETTKFQIDGVYVIQEMFSTETDDIVYQFVAEKATLKGV